MSLTVTSLRTGNTVDEVGLAEGVLSYRTGAAREIFEAMRGRMQQGSTDEDLYALMNGWNNGYLAITEAQDVAALQR